MGQWSNKIDPAFANLGVLRTVCDASNECLDRHPADSAVVRTRLFEENE
jgi:hypothetical protein